MHRPAPKPRLLTVLAGILVIMLLAGAAAAATQAGPEAPGLLGAFAVLLGCGDPFDAAIMARDALDEAEFVEALDPGLLSWDADDP